jgi:D-xylose transport system ATP-binding protein
MSAAGAPTLEIRDAVVRYGPILAVDRVSFHVHSGEVLALLGDNGAGKSSLIRCISGVQNLDRGEILLDGVRVNLKGAADAQRRGIETVYQDLALFDNLSIAANFFAGREQKWPRLLWHAGLLRERSMAQAAAATLERLQVNLPSPRAQVGLLSGGQRQAIAVARAVSFASRVVILDEPTAALGVRESRNVLELVRRLPEQGLAVVLVSHNLEHVAAVADRAVVLRRGKFIGEAVPTAENHDRVVAMIVGALASGQNGHGDDGERWSPMK